MNLFHFHNWDKWSDPVNGIGTKVGSDAGYFKVLQMRVCKTCGVAAIRTIPQMRSIASLREEGTKK